MAKQIRTFSGSNILTFDIEDWYHANYDHVNLDESRGKGSHFKANVENLLQLCRDTESKATFFVLGSIGEDYPDVVRAIASEGHDVACHGYSHQLAYQQTIGEFKADVKKSVDILEKLTGTSIIGYRAPSWSIVEKNFHYLEVLEELGMKYDASIFPVKTFLYGIPTAPTEIHKPKVNGRELNLYEVPMSVMSLWGKNMGYSGGFYFRFFPKWLIKSAIRSANRQRQSSIIYLHPREIDATEQRLSLPYKESFIQYYNIQGTKDKLQDIMRSFSFTSIAEHLKYVRKTEMK